MHIVALAPHAHRELHGLDCSLLTDQSRRLLEFGALSEWQLGRIAPTVQQRRRKRLAKGEGWSGRVFSNRNINFPPCDACSYLYSPAAVENTLIWALI